MTELTPNDLNSPVGVATVDRGDWDTAAWKLLRSEMRRRKVGYKELARRLQALGISEDPDSLNRKVSRKKFRAGLLMACLHALGCEVSLKARE